MVNVAVAATLLAVMVTVWAPVGAFVAIVKDNVSWPADALLTVTAVRPVLGPMLTWPAPTPARLKHPVFVTVKLVEVPAVT